MSWSYTGRCTWNGSTDCMHFQISDGQTTRSWRVSAEALEDHCGARGDYEAAFQSCVDTIVATAIRKHNKGLVEVDGTVLVRAADL